MRRTLSLIAGLTLVGGNTALAQDGANPFSTPKNLKVLPEDISSSELRDIMRQFSFATGIRCSGCHVPKEGAPLSEWDFQSDDKDQKRIAREMLKLTADINKKVGKIDDVDAAAAVKVRCMTCHRGIEQPKLIQDVLDEYKTANNTAGAIDHYREIRETYYGSHTYDFSPFTLGQYAQDAQSEGAAEFAFALHDLNRELNPEDDRPYAAWGNSLMRAKDYEGAITAYKKAAELNPEAAFYQQLIAQAESALAAQGE